jgi:alanyl-tRNA synthetase
MGEAYPELRAPRPHRRDPQAGGEPLPHARWAAAWACWRTATANLGEGGVLSGETAFRLYDTYGFPLDLTQDAVRAKGLTVDTDAFDAAMQKQREMARANWSGSGQQAGRRMVRDARPPGATVFTGYDATETRARCWPSSSGGVEVDGGRAGQTVEVLFDRTPSTPRAAARPATPARSRPTAARPRARHPEAGRRPARPPRRDHCRATWVGDQVVAAVDAERRLTTRANHSAAHLLHAALRHVLGPTWPRRARWSTASACASTSATAPPSDRGRARPIEAEVNAVIRQNVPAETKLMAPQEAIEAGAVALFGEKYGDSVRVLTLGQVADRRRQGLFGRAVRRHPRGPHRRHRPVQDRLGAGRRRRRAPHRGPDRRGGAPLPAGPGRGGQGAGRPVQGPVAEVLPASTAWSPNAEARARAGRGQEAARPGRRRRRGGRSGRDRGSRP